MYEKKFVIIDTLKIEGQVDYADKKSTNKLGNSFWESQGLKDRNDLVYRNRNLNYTKFISCATTVDYYE